MAHNLICRNLPEDPNQDNPIYCNQASGLMSCGSKRNLLSAVKKGKSIKLWFNSGLPSTASLQRLEIDTQANDCNVIGQAVFRIGVSMSSTTFALPLYWWHAMFSTLGTAKITRWYIGENLKKADSVSAYDLAWYVDVCWSFAFMHSDNGIQISGSVESLEAHILVGRRVRVLFDSYTMEADNVLISNTRLITAQFLSQMDTSTSMTFSAGYWKWVRISTDGSFFTDIYQMGSSTKVSSSVTSITASWFVERRGWNRILVTSPNGTVMEGSKTDLVLEIRHGSRLRCAVVFDINDTLVFTADNIEIHSDGNVAAQMFRYLQFDDGTLGSSVPYWRIMLVCTTGKLQESRWTVGEHVKRGEVLHDVTTYWFVDT
ncbi:hypothetical protein KP79_PYT12806 [Mizuhopecten yessoensis]|uniref:Uncharacterized protein n=1 Tax=Mizuhopecten yessoensis TaxID=6573 RepID=A0A210PNK8_MIZYE|nr:hypothetical protein KP79_PYT12806 [Mizuhopecten yessoensis]